MSAFDVQGPAPDHRLLDVAAALADGSAVEWPTPDSVDLGTRDLLDRLRSIHRVSEAFRRASTPGEGDRSVPMRVPRLSRGGICRYSNGWEGAASGRCTGRGTR
jgi:hypothetical protein